MLWQDCDCISVKIKHQRWVLEGWKSMRCHPWISHELGSEGIHCACLWRIMDNGSLLNYRGIPCHSWDLFDWDISGLIFGFALGRLTFYLQSSFLQDLPHHYCQGIFPKSQEKLSPAEFSWHQLIGKLLKDTEWHCSSPASACSMRV